MRRILLLAALLVVAFLGGRAIWRAMASDATRIRWLFEGEAAAFNDCAGLSVLESFAPDWQDETTGTSRQMLRGGLMWVFQNRRDPKTQRFLYRIEMGELDVDIDGDRAKATVPLVLHHGLDDDRRPVWELRVLAELGRKDGSWRVERSRHETISGAVPR
jgi:hypothetical protein